MFLSYRYLTDILPYGHFYTWYKSLVLKRGVKCYVWYDVLFVILYVVMVYNSVLLYGLMGCQDEWHMSLNERVMCNFYFFNFTFI